MYIDQRRRSPARGGVLVCLFLSLLLSVGFGGLRYRQRSWGEGKEGSKEK